MQDDIGMQEPPAVGPRAAIGIGLAAAVVMTVLMVALRFALDSPSLLELMADKLTALTPVEVFDFILARLQVGAKPLLFALLLAGQVAVGTVIGILYVLYSPKLPVYDTQPWRRGFLVGAVWWLLFAGLVTPLVDGGFFGSAVIGGSFPYLVALLVSFGAYGLTLSHLHLIALGDRDAPADMGRRRVLRQGAFLALLVVAGAYSGRAIIQGLGSISPARVFNRPGEMPAEVTPNEEFYEVSKNIVNPKVEVTGWTLEVEGGVGSPYVIDYAELQKLPWIEEYATLTCISNLVGGGLISNALWRGVPLNVILGRAQLPESTERLAFHAADGYVDSIPMDYAMRDNVIVAYMMNGVPLPDGHGFPARIIVPGLYGMENVKWLTRIEPVPADFRGFWQVRGWDGTAVINTMSRIDVPRRNAGLLLEEAFLGGVAFAGDRGVQRVEVSTDGSETWRPAEMSDPLSKYTWVLWTTTWNPLSTGPFEVVVRATDGRGDTQTSVVRGNVPSGATGYHKVPVLVS